MRFALLLACSVLLLLFSSFLAHSATPAHADVEGNCEALVAGERVRGRNASSAGDAIRVEEDSSVIVSMTSPAGFESHGIQIEIAGISRTVSSQDDHNGAPQWSGEVKVNDYAWAGVGLYRVTGTSVLSDGSTCTGAALIDVQGNPLTTVAGGVAAVATALGAVGLAASGVASAAQGAKASGKIEDWILNEIESQPASPGAGQEAGGRPYLAEKFDQMTSELTGMLWGPCGFFILPALLLTGVAMATGGAPSSGSPRVRLPRAPWRPRISAVGVIGGLLAGLGIAVLLQQYAVSYLTLLRLIEWLALGLVVGVAVPTVVSTWHTMRINRKLTAAERRLSSRGGGTAPPPPAGEDE